MGLLWSKPVENPSKITSAEETGSIPSTPILTPKVVKSGFEGYGNIDPRSPSKHIVRTPIELSSNSGLNTNIDDSMTSMSPQSHFILNVDPRSPSEGITRTPIYISASPDNKVPANARNKHLEKVRISDRINSGGLSMPRNANIPESMSPKLLESTPVKPKVMLNNNKRKSLVFLETNIDFTETDLDAIIKIKLSGNSAEDLCSLKHSVEFEKTPIKASKSSELLTEESDNKHVEEDNIDNHVDTSTVSAEQDEKPPSEIITDTTNIHNDLSCNEDCKRSEIVEDITSDTDHLTNIDIKNTEMDLPACIKEENAQMSTEILDSCVTSKSKASDNAFENIPEPMKNQQFISNDPEPRDILDLTTEFISKSATSHDIKIITEKSKSQTIQHSIVNLTADVKELDKKLTNLIYEDEDPVICPRAVTVKDQTRAPLVQRNNDENAKSSQKLKVRDKPRGKEDVMSKIPVFKQKKIKVQCENTPPKAPRAGKAKKSHWDMKDQTLVI